MYQVQENRVIESLCHMQGRRDSVGSLVERGGTVLTQGVLVGGDNGTAVIKGNVPDRLQRMEDCDDKINWYYSDIIASG